MRISIKKLIFVMLHGGVWILDLDTGEPISYQLMAERKIKKPRRYIRLPSVSKVQVFQAYYKKLFHEIPMIDDPYGLKSFPDYQRVLQENLYFDEYEYIDKAHNFWENIVEGLIYRNRRVDNPDFDPLFPTFDEYRYAFALQCAKEWCEQEGYEWYED